MSASQLPNDLASRSMSSLPQTQQELASRYVALLQNLGITNSHLQQAQLLQHQQQQQQEMTTQQQTNNCQPFPSCFPHQATTPQIALSYPAGVTQRLVPPMSAPHPGSGDSLQFFLRATSQPAASLSRPHTVPSQHQQAYMTQASNQPMQQQQQYYMTNPQYRRTQQLQQPQQRSNHVMHHQQLAFMHLPVFLATPVHHPHQCCAAEGVHHVSADTSSRTIQTVPTARTPLPPPVDIQQPPSSSRDSNRSRMWVPPLDLSFLHEDSERTRRAVNTEDDTPSPLAEDTLETAEGMARYVYESGMNVLRAVRLMDGMESEIREMEKLQEAAGLWWWNLDDQEDVQGKSRSSDRQAAVTQLALAHGHMGAVLGCLRSAVRLIEGGEAEDDTGRVEAAEEVGQALCHLVPQARELSDTLHNAIHRLVGALPGLEPAEEVSQQEGEPEGSDSRRNERSSAPRRGNGDTRSANDTWEMACAKANEMVQQSVATQGGEEEEEGGDDDDEGKGEGEAEEWVGINNGEKNCPVCGMKTLDGTDDEGEDGEGDEDETSEEGSDEDADDEAEEKEEMYSEEELEAEEEERPCRDTKSSSLSGKECEGVAQHRGSPRGEDSASGEDAVSRSVQTLSYRRTPYRQWDLTNTAPNARTYRKMDHILSTVWGMEESVFCRRRLSRRKNPDYYHAIKDPMFLDKVGKKLNVHMYESVEHFVHDLRLIWYNTRLFYPPGSEQQFFACRIEVKLDTLLRAHFGSAMPFISGWPDEMASHYESQTDDHPSVCMYTPSGHQFDHDVFQASPQAEGDRLRES